MSTPILISLHDEAVVATHPPRVDSLSCGLYGKGSVGSIPARVILNIVFAYDPTSLYWSRHLYTPGSSKSHKCLGDDSKVRLCEPIIL